MQSGREGSRDWRLAGRDHGRTAFGVSFLATNGSVLPPETTETEPHGSASSLSDAVSQSQAAARARWTIWVNAAASRTARSASILRSMAISATVK